MAISERRASQALGDLARGVAGAVRSQEGDGLDDPFTLALKRYEAGGIPVELASRWRPDTTAPADSAPVLRKLDRDLLSGVVQYATSPQLQDEQGPEGAATETVPALHAVGEPGPPPSLVMGPDGAWHADQAPQAGTSSRGRLAGLAGLASRYPDPLTVARQRPLLDRIGPAAATAAAAARVAERPAPVPFVAPAAEPGAADAASDELLQTVSGGVEVVVGPFLRMQQLAAFTRALAAMPGVRDVSAQRFQKGVVHVRVRYEDDVPLTDRLAQLREFSPTFVSVTRSRIELRVESPDDAPAQR